MELFEESEGETRLRVGMRGGVPFLSNELLPPRASCSRAVAEVDRYRVKSVGVKNKEVTVASSRVCAVFVWGMPKLYA